MPGLVPGIHVFLSAGPKTWMAGTKPGMTTTRELYHRMPLRLIFMGTPDFAVPTLLELAAHGHEIAAVYTRAAKPGGRRGLQLQPTPVEQEARRLDIPVLTPTTLKTPEALEEFRAITPMPPWSSPMA